MDLLTARAWRDESGTPVAIHDYDAPLVLSEAYTSCAVRCPMTLESLKAMDRALTARGVHASFVVVTLDPATDTPERLGRFKESRALDDHFHFLSGSAEATRALSKFLRVRAIYDDTHIDHDVRTALFDVHRRRTRTYAGWSFDAEDLARGARGEP